ncbi:MAG: NAD-dependent epimerase/dehydratase family protein [bacterium]|nr:NAD-dependent epimerase/dehydratase family protein [bacterium]
MASSLAQRRVLVTGGAGFIGSHVVDALLARGCLVTVVDDLSTGRAENLPPGVDLHRLDIASADFLSLVRDRHPELVVHLAAQASVSRSVADPIADATTNALGTINLLRACVQARVRKVVFTASGGTAYGETKEPATEDLPLLPISPYGITKLAGELYLRHFQAEHGLSYVSLRLANIYGPRQDPAGEAGVVAIFSHRMLTGQQPVIFGDGRCVRDYVYVADVVEAVMVSVGHAGHGSYNIGTGRGTTVNELYSALARLCNFDRPATYGPPRPGDLRYSVLDPSRSERELGWSSRFSLEEGLAQTVAAFRADRGE